MHFTLEWAQDLPAAAISAVALRVTEAQRAAVRDLQAQLSDQDAADSLQLH